MAIALLAKAGFAVVAATGKASEGDYLKQLGATEVIDRARVDRRRVSRCRKSVGPVLSTASAAIRWLMLCAQTCYGGAVAACGLAQGMDFPASVAPFILRGVSLLGIESVMAPRPPRLAAWGRLARDLDGGLLETIATEIGLADAIPAAADLMAGKIRGRVVVNVNK